MTPESFEEVLRRTVDTFGAMAEKVIRVDPSWDELPRVLTSDELAVFQQFTLAARRLRESRP